MPAKNVVRFYDYERKSREPDAAGPRDPTEAVVIKLEPRHNRQSDDGASIGAQLKIRLPNEHVVTDVCGCERCRREFGS